MPTNKKSMALYINMAQMRRRMPRRRRAAKRMVKRPARLSKPVARAVKAIVNRQQERKYRNESYQRTLNAICNNVTNEMFPCVPQLEQATAVSSSSQRIGQKVTCARAYTDFHICLAPGATGSKDLIVKLWVLASKELKNYDDIAAWGTAGNRPLPINFLNDGNGGTKTSLGFLYDLDAPVESEQWTSLKEMTFRLSKSTGVIENSSSGFSATAPFAYVASAGATSKRIRVYHKAPKNWQYDGNLFPQYPNNYAPVWTLSYAYADGTAPVAANSEIYVNVTNHLEFYDA